MTQRGMTVRRVSNTPLFPSTQLIPAQGDLSWALPGSHEDTPRKECVGKAPLPPSSLRPVHPSCCSRPLGAPLTTLTAGQFLVTSPVSASLYSSGSSLRTLGTQGIFCVGKHSDCALFSRVFLCPCHRMNLLLGSWLVPGPALVYCGNWGQ